MKAHSRFTAKNGLPLYVELDAGHRRGGAYAPPSGWQAALLLPLLGLLGALLLIGLTI